MGTPDNMEESFLVTDSWKAVRRRPHTVTTIFPFCRLDSR